MVRSLLPRITLLLGVIAVNAVLWASSPARAGESAHRGQCTYYGGFEPHCHCEKKITEYNCGLDSDCDWGVCDT